LEWLKQKVRGTVAHRLYRHVNHWRSGKRASELQDLNAAYDRQTVDVMRRILRPDSICIDVGAHCGEILEHMVTLAPSGIHHAFEALPHLAVGLRAKFPQVQIHQVAVGDHSGESEFQFVENDPAYSGLRRRIYDRPDPSIRTIRVPIAPLDEAIPSDQHIAFIKIDIEGGEYHALKGAAGIVRRCRPVIVFEAGLKSTGQYGITAAQLYELVTDTLGYELSTMGRWLAAQSGMTSREFCQNWDEGPDYYFIAVPFGRAA
jgi:FkbM family methyltransferase